MQILLENKAGVREKRLWKQLRNANEGCPPWGIDQVLGSGNREPRTSFAGTTSTCT